MNGSALCNTRAYTTCANRSVCLSMAQIYGLHMHHRCILCLRRGGSRSRKGWPPAHRGAFILGLSGSAQEVIVGRQGEAGTLAITPPPKWLNKHYGLCAQLWDSKELLFLFFNSGIALVVPATAPVLAWSEIAIWRWRLIPPIALCPTLKTP